MAERVIMPSMGLTMDEGTILEWLKQEGDPVAKDDALLVVETDKAALEVPSPYAGVLVSIAAQAGETIAVGGTIAFVGEPGEAVEERRSISPRRRQRRWRHSPRLERPPLLLGGARQRASSHREHVAWLASCGLDALALAGTGPSGRIVERDMRAVGLGGASRTARGAHHGLTSGAEAGR